MTDATLYHKIAGPFKRNPATGKVEIGTWNDPIVEALASAPVWVATEKIDGTNIRVIWDGHTITVGGRTARAELHGHLVAKIESYFKREGIEEWLEETFGEKEVIFVGEGYGAGIQKGGGAYSAEKDFIGFDIIVEGKYLGFDSVREIYALIGVPALASVSTRPEPLWTFIHLVQNGCYSEVAKLKTNTDTFAEGVVATTRHPLYDNRGNRVIVKIKHVDLYEGE